MQHPVGGASAVTKDLPSGLLKKSANGSANCIHHVAGWSLVFGPVTPVAGQLTSTPHFGKVLRMATSAYRIKNSITALILRGNRERLHCLKVGDLLFPMSGRDSVGMIMARFEQETVQVFERDLEEGCEPIELQVAKPASAS
jgi:hypothetical protein